MQSLRRLWVLLNLKMAKRKRSFFLFFPFQLDVKFAGLLIDLHADNGVAAY